MYIFSTIVYFYDTYQPQTYEMPLNFWHHRCITTIGRHSMGDFMKLIFFTLSLFSFSCLAYENQSCESKYSECEKIHTSGYCVKTLGDCSPTKDEVNLKKENLKGFKTIKITSSLDGRYFKSGNKSLTILDVHYPAQKCNIEAGDTVYIVSELTRYYDNNKKSGQPFIKVYNPEKDSYCELM